MDEKSNKLRKIGAWTLAVYATVFAVTFATLWLAYYKTLNSELVTIWKIFSTAWGILLADFVLCAGVFMAYKMYLKKRR